MNRARELLARVLRDRRRSTLWWAAGLTLTVAVMLAFYPAFKDQPDLDRMLEGMPDAVRIFSGLEEGESYFAPAGYLNSQLFSNMLPVLLLVLSIGFGASAIAGYEADGRLESVLSQPVRRREVYVSRVGATVLLPIGLGLLAGVVTAALAPVAGMDGVSTSGVLAASLAVGVLAATHGLLALAVGAATGRKGSAQAVGALVAVAGFVLYGFGQAVASWRTASTWTPWYWYLGSRPLTDGVSFMAIVLPFVVAAPFVVAGWWRFERRDLH